ncbi:MAG: DNA-3-methyladenine glycosylase [Methanomicrobiales archaeon]|nr:DNA-3-methyladenine glycosylase [Methanomicrobiales archaeon]MDI6875466.1 DNA-3-methyladenine glycosylase [Methanomicrobiales archaeon]
MILQQAFYEQDTVGVAKQLLGCYLVHLEGERTAIGRIVETEAYLEKDPAAHSYRGMTRRNSVMFGPVGHAYVYLIYGLHTCINAVSGREGAGEAVLIRALEPLEGVAWMQQRRGVEKIPLLCNGPGKLTEALGISLACNGIPLYEGPIQIWGRDSLPIHRMAEMPPIVQTTRIGITKAAERPLRFYLAGNRFVSRRER